ncbi:MAG: hypothetical protein JJ971_14680 [Balneolaceae bacterium]|nr:hypothetical protein [Balneolaceae bacterium]MBO6547643.1 hypothetical protein [Balneolaceae bacterium]MBO6648154.1 hypothetical protein [Balneolaceae bacterium]
MEKRVLGFLIVMFLVMSCAEVVPIDPAVTAEPYGFWSGLWHGIIAPFSFIGSLFKEDIAVYALNNTGGWYDFGFLLGVGTFLGGGSKGARRKKKSN